MPAMSEQLAAVGRLALAPAAPLLGQLDGRAGDPLVHEAAGHATGVAAVGVAAVEEAARAAGAEPGEGNAHARHAHLSGSDRPLWREPPTRYAAVQHSPSRRAGEGAGRVRGPRGRG